MAHYELCSENPGDLRASGIIPTGSQFQGLLDYAEQYRAAGDDFGAEYVTALDALVAAREASGDATLWQEMGLDLHPMADFSARFPDFWELNNWFDSNPDNASVQGIREVAFTLAALDSEENQLTEEARRNGLLDVGYAVGQLVYSDDITVTPPMAQAAIELLSRDMSVQDQALLHLGYQIYAEPIRLAAEQTGAATTRNLYIDSEWQKRKIKIGIIEFDLEYIDQRSILALSHYCPDRIQNDLGCLGSVSEHSRFLKNVTKENNSMIVFL